MTKVVFLHRTDLPYGVEARPWHIRDNGESITPAEVAMETSLTVREADRMLSELAGGGHLYVQSTGGTLRYSLSSRRAPELDETGSETD
jgi:hypothetical protein